MGLLNNYPIPGYLTGIKTYNHVILLDQKHVSTLPPYVAIINGIFQNWPLKKKQKTQKRYRLKMSLSWTAWLGHHQTILKTIRLVYLKPATVTHLGIILFNWHVMYIPYRNNIYVMHLILRLSFLRMNYFFQSGLWKKWEKLPIGIISQINQSLSWWS